MITPISVNRKSGSLAEVEKFEAGLVLTGDEVKSCRAGRVGLTSSFVKIVSGEPLVYNLRIDRYLKSGHGENWDGTRVRRLLLTRREIERISGLTSQKGKTVIPLRMYLKKNLIKIELGVGVELKKYERREKIKERESRREDQRELKELVGRA